MAQQVQNGVPQAKKTKNDEHSSVTLFRDYLRVKTVQPEPDYGKYAAAIVSINGSSGK